MKIRENLFLYILMLFFFNNPGISSLYSQQLSSDPPQIVLYYEIGSTSGKDVSLTIDKLFLEGEKDTFLLTPIIKELHTKENENTQIVLIESSIPEGNYTSIHIYFSRVSTHAGVAKIHPKPVPGGISLPVAINAAKGNAYPVFIIWDPSKDSYKKKVYTPSFHARDKIAPPSGSVAFVSNEKSGYVTVIDRFTYKVVDIIKVGKNPMGLISSSINQELYVANTGSNSLTVIDILSFRTIKTIQLNLGDEPGRIYLSPDQRFLYVLNRGTSSLAIINLRSHQEENRLSLNSGYSDLAIDDITGNIYISDNLSDKIMVYDPLHYSVIREIHSGSSPMEICLNSRAQKLYFSQMRQRTITVFDTEKMKVFHHISLCSPASGMIFNPITGTLFVALGACKEISVFQPDKIIETGTIMCDGQPGQISFDPDHKQLLVSFPASNQIAFYNINSRKQEACINVGRKPYQIIVP